jgi:hypothetical protein
MFVLPVPIRPTLIDVVLQDSLTPGVLTVTSGDIDFFELPNGLTRGVGAFASARFDKKPEADPLFLVEFVVTLVGAGDADVNLSLAAKYVSPTEDSTKAADETLTPTLAVTNVVDRRHSFTFTLDRTLIEKDDLALFTLQRIGGADPFTGRVGICQSARMEVVV